jgi:hypothetical protein
MATRGRIVVFRASSSMVNRTDALSHYRRVRELSWPRRFPIAQFPNNSLITAFVAGYVAARLHGAAQFDAQATSYLAMTIWAYAELAHGVNWFRHLLGLVYLISTGAHLAAALGH